MTKLYNIVKINYDTIPLTIDYSKYNTSQTIKLPNGIELKGDPIIEKIPVIAPMGFIVRPKIGGKVRIITDEDGNSYAMLVDLINIIPPNQEDGDCIVGNFLKGTYCKFNEKSIEINSNEELTINSTNTININTQTNNIKATQTNIEGDIQNNGNTTIQQNLTVNGSTNITGNLNAGIITAGNGATGTFVDTPTNKSITIVSGIITAIN